MIISVATHVLSTVYISKEKLQLMQKMANDFLWCGRNHLKEKTVQNIWKWGGLQHIHMKHIMHKIQVKWMEYIWLDKGQSWSYWTWHKIMETVPEQIILGITAYSEHLIQQISPFYQQILHSYAYLNWQDVCVDKPRNIWATELFPGVNKHLITLGIVQIGDIPMKGNTIDLRNIQYRAQQIGITEDFFLICSALQSKLKPHLRCLIWEGAFPHHLSQIAKKLLLVECKIVVNLSGWELSLGLNIDFDEQQ